MTELAPGPAARRFPVVSNDAPASSVDRLPAHVQFTSALLTLVLRCQATYSPPIGTPCESYQASESGLEGTVPHGPMNPVRILAVVLPGAMVGSLTAKVAFCAILRASGAGPHRD